MIRLLLYYIRLRVFLGEWFPCSFGSEITPWKERVWGISLFTEGGGEGCICDVGDGVALAFG